MLKEVIRQLANSKENMSTVMGGQLQLAGVTVAEQKALFGELKDKNEKIMDIHSSGNSSLKGEDYMKTTPPHRLSVILISLLTIIVLLYLTFVIVSVPPIGAELHKRSDGTYFVLSVEPASHAKVKSIDVGDQIVEVNGAPVGKYINILKYNTIENADNVLVIHKNGEREIISFSKGWSNNRSTTEMMIQLYIPGISLLIFLRFPLFYM